MKLILESTENILVNDHGNVAREWRGVTGKGHTVKVVIVGIMPVPLTRAALEELAADLSIIVDGTTADQLWKAFQSNKGWDGSFKLAFKPGRGRKPAGDPTDDPIEGY